MRKDVYIVRIILLGVLVVGGFAALSMHVYHLQIERHDELFRKARLKYTSQQRQKGERGNIFDTQGKLFAGNMYCRDILAEPGKFRKPISQVANDLSSFLNVPKSVLQKRFSLDQVEVPVKREVTVGKAEQLDLRKYGGLRLVETKRRFYPQGELAANIIGFTNSEQKGVSGVEQMFDETLQPTEGKVKFEKAGDGNILPNTRSRMISAKDGDDVHLTIDSAIQSIVETGIERLVKKHNPKAAYAIMVDPDTGAIMALAQRPTFNPNKREHMEPSRYQNRIATCGFEPGSVMKPVTVGGALMYDVVDIADTFDCEKGLWHFRGQPLHDAHSFGELKVWQILQKSSNIGTAKIAVKMGNAKLYQTLCRFGFGEKTALNFKHESAGILRSLDDWDGLSVSRFCIGQGVLVTPLQLVRAYCALANDGLMMSLRILDKIQSSEGKIIRRTEPQARRWAVKPDTAKRIEKALALVTKEDGTAEEASVPGYSVAGKTGTAQKVVDGEYSHEKYVSSFAGFVPAGRPAFVLLVVADEPSKNGYYASQVAAPAFRWISEKTLRYLRVPPVTKQSSEEEKSYVSTAAAE